MTLEERIVLLEKQLAVVLEALTYQEQLNAVLLRASILTPDILARAREKVK